MENMEFLSEECMSFEELPIEEGKGIDAVKKAVKNVKTGLGRAAHSLAPVVKPNTPVQGFTSYGPKICKNCE